MAVAIDVRAMVDHYELSLRRIFACLGAPEQPDSYWDELSADLTDIAAICLNACAVMADASQLATAFTEEF